MLAKQERLVVLSLERVALLLLPLFLVKVMKVPHFIGVNSELSLKNFAVDNGNQSLAEVATDLHKLSCLYLLVIFDSFPRNRSGLARGVESRL